MRRYLGLLVGAVAVALMLRVAVRGPARARGPEASAPAEAAVALSLAVADGEVAPEASVVPKDRRVNLAIVNRGARPARFALAGYEDRLPERTVAPGDTARVEFLADRPGEDFAWLVDGRPAGRLTVAGSHLIEGHR
jgi:hypothetical protein